MTTGEQLHQINEKFKKADRLREQIMSRLTTGEEFDTVEAWAEYERLEQEAHAALRKVMLSGRK
jgi:hypothetical protein